jgi:hypothetical protein
LAVAESPPEVPFARRPVRPDVDGVADDRAFGIDAREQVAPRHSDSVESEATARSELRQPVPAAGQAVQRVEEIAPGEPQSADLIELPSEVLQGSVRHPDRTWGHSSPKTTRCRSSSTSAMRSSDAWAAGGSSSSGPYTRARPRRPRSMSAASSSTSDATASDSEAELTRTTMPRQRTQRDRRRGPLRIAGSGRFADSCRPPHLPSFPRAREVPFRVANRALGVAPASHRSGP